MALRDIRDTQQPHSRFHLILHNIDEVLYALLTVRQRIQERPPHADGFRTETQSLNDIRAATDPAIDEHFEMLEHLRVMSTDFQQRQ